MVSNDNKERVMIENLSVMLPADSYTVVRWVPFSQPDVRSYYRVTIDFLRFDGTPGDNVSVKARWSVFGKDGGLQEVHESDIVQQVKGTDHGSMVEGMSKGIELLSRDIANAIKG